MGGIRPPVIGLAGPSCAGKNAAGDILARRGFAVIDADKIAHEVLEELKNRILEEFREAAATKSVSLLRQDGSLDRKALGSLLFADPALLARHESIVYPRITEILGRMIDENREHGVVINAALLHKTPILDRFDFLIFVDAWLPIRFVRALRRDKIPPKRVFHRFQSQKNLFAQYLLKNVDIQRVDNSTTVRALERKLAKLLSRRGY